MRQAIDTALVSRAQGVIDDMIADPIGYIRRGKVPQYTEKPIYVRGALVKTSKRDNRKDSK